MENMNRRKEVLEMLLHSDFSTFEIAKRMGIEEHLVSLLLEEELNGK